MQKILDTIALETNAMDELTIIWDILGHYVCFRWRERYTRCLLDNGYKVH